MAIYWIEVTTIKFRKGRERDWFEESELALLRPREQLVLRLVSTMDDGIRHSNVLVGELLGIKISRVRAITSEALSTLRHLRREEREETWFKARRLPPLPGKAKISVKDAKRWVEKGTDNPWRFPEEEENDQLEVERLRPIPDHLRWEGWPRRTPPEARIRRQQGSRKIKPVPSPTFGFRILPGAGIYLCRYGVLVPATSYRDGRVTQPDGRLSILPG